MDKPFKINDVVWVFLTLAVIGLVYYLISNNIIPGPSAIIQKNITPTISLEQSPPPEGSQVACTLEAKICRDGVTVVGREGPDCEFAKCPGEKQCPQDIMTCSDGSFVMRQEPDCEFAPCPE
ncbi:hypothetical protein A3A93_05450 [Candidatus Roizmanbacteria bacterium RIFCSPLOWO2_01_FULL_38_12]|uniref:Uncharacterized protein n=1 Tax=Candidatus Roizmanbacteria bacterium RIFCSPLOWO2_01_FULL_38_12 TaxID=1802061 RepID=A0A1F7IZ36_9BACT|nr:MAG: hypothetical protein A2861_03665 [Candidatus Roizmanbacteria bacterium RIFCSPHIGHO2_01_FULL_38_15]OGK48632.1 MAG: hypothetical protein A3A93_05450 [Candidatus Roizmanbacteria bacterium RIFCSPLOWO2_01_FULL_38_12]